MTFFNTTNLTGKALISAIESSNSQDARVIKYFMSHTIGWLLGFSPSQVWSSEFDKAPLTSIRRTITNLTNCGYLIKTERQVEGFYGKLEYVWKLAPPYKSDAMILRRIKRQNN